MESRFQFSVSPFLVASFAFASAVATAGILLIISIPLPIRIVLAAGILLLFVLAMRKHAFLLGKSATHAVAFLPKGEVEIIRADGETRYGQLQSATVSPVLTVFVAQCDNRTIGVIAAFDSMHHDLHRQLRIHILSVQKEKTGFSSQDLWQYFRDLLRNQKEKREN